MFNEINGNFGFGCMRLPMVDGAVDYVEFSKMIDYFIENGFNYFDTARGYLDGKSEIALRECLAKRYPRESFLLTNKLSDWCFKDNADIRPFFESQLEACGVEYFDFYLLHAQNKNNYKKYKAARAYEEAFALKKEGKVRHVGLSFHDTADVLDMILTDYPEIEVVQIQFNYLDYNDKMVQGRECYEVCRKHGKPIIIMEPVKGGLLATPPQQVVTRLTAMGEGSPASYAIRFSASFEGVVMTLSGMGNMDMMRDNLAYMKGFTPLNKDQLNSLIHYGDIMRNEGKQIPCTSCRYCVAGCPANIAIPDYFSCYNNKMSFNNWQGGYFYSLLKNEGAHPDACIECGSCEEVCPQRLEIRELLKKVSEAFKNEED